VATIYVNRAYPVIAGVPVTAFNVGYGDITSIRIDHNNNVTPVAGLNYRPVAIGIIDSTQDVTVAFEYTFQANQSFFDFYQFPYDLTNVQLLLQSESDFSWYLVSNLYFKGQRGSFPNASVAAKRSIVFGAFDIVCLPGGI
jgi:hypothetical protein